MQAIALHHCMGIDMRIDIYEDMFIDMCADMCIDMCACMCADTFIGMCARASTAMPSLAVCTDMCVDMCVDVCVDLCLDIYTGMYIGVCYMHVHRHMIAGTGTTLLRSRCVICILLKKSIDLCRHGVAWYACGAYVYA